MENLRGGVSPNPKRFYAFRMGRPLYQFRRDLERSAESQGIPTKGVESLQMTFDPKAPRDLIDLQIWFGQMSARPLRKLGGYRLPDYESPVAMSIEERISPGP